jgi:hypothetical protein
VTAAIVMVLAGGVFVLTRSGKTTPIEQQPVTPRAEPVPEPPRIQVKELPPEKVAEPVAQEPPDSRPPAVTPLPERPPESVPEQPPQPATIPPELRVSMALLRANGKDQWTESVNLRAD